MQPLVRVLTVSDSDNQYNTADCIDCQRQYDSDSDSMTVLTVNVNDTADATPERVRRVGAACQRDEYLTLQTAGICKARDFRARKKGA